MKHLQIYSITILLAIHLKLTTEEADEQPLLKNQKEIQIKKPKENVNNLRKLTDSISNLNQKIATENKSQKLTSSNSEKSQKSDRSEDETQLTSSDLDDLMREDPDFDSEEAVSKKTETNGKDGKMKLDNEDDWMKEFSEEIGSSLSELSSNKKSIPQVPLDFEEDDTSEGNMKAKIEILEITADNATSYTEMQILVQYLEQELHVAKFGDENTFIISKFESRKAKLDKDTLGDIAKIKEYLKNQNDEIRKKIHNEMINNMAGISELSYSEDSDTESKSTKSVNDDMIHSISELSDPSGGKGTNNELESLLNLPGDDSGGNLNQKLSGPNLMNMLGGAGGPGGGQGNNGFMDFLKLMGSMSGTNNGKQEGMDLKKMVDSLGALMKNPMMENILKNGQKEQPKDDSNQLYERMAKQVIPDNVRDKELDEEMKDGMNKLLKEEMNNKNMTQKEKWDSIRKQQKEEANLKKQGFGKLHKVAVKGDFFAQPEVEKVTMNKKTGDKDVYIDFGEIEENSLKKQSKKNDKNPKEQKKENAKNNGDIVEVKDFKRTLNTDGLIKIGRYVKKPEEKKRGMILV